MSSEPRSTPAWRQDPLRHPVRTVVMGLIRFYQLWISPALPPSCRFYPSCSAYTMTAVERFGPVRGIRLGMWRLARCNPWNLGGVDHVPEKGPDGRPVQTRRGEDAGPPSTSHTA